MEESDDDDATEDEAVALLMASSKSLVGGHVGASAVSLMYCREGIGIGSGDAGCTGTRIGVADTTRGDGVTMCMLGVVVRTPLLFGIGVRSDTSEGARGVTVSPSRSPMGATTVGLLVALNVRDMDTVTVGVGATDCIQLGVQSAGVPTAHSVIMDAPEASTLLSRKVASTTATIVDRSQLPRSTLASTATPPTVPSAAAAHVPLYMYKSLTYTSRGPN